MSKQIFQIVSLFDYEIIASVISHSDTAFISRETKQSVSAIENSSTLGLTKYNRGTLYVQQYTNLMCRLIDEHILLK